MQTHKINVYLVPKGEDCLFARVCFPGEPIEKVVNTNELYIGYSHDTYFVYVPCYNQSDIEPQKQTSEDSEYDNKNSIIQDVLGNMMPKKIIIDRRIDDDFSEFTKQLLMILLHPMNQKYRNVVLTVKSLSFSSPLMIITDLNDKAERIKFCLRTNRVQCDRDTFMALLSDRGKDSMFRFYTAMIDAQRLGQKTLRLDVYGNVKEIRRAQFKLLELLVSNMDIDTITQYSYAMYKSFGYASVYEGCVDFIEWVEKYLEKYSQVINSRRIPLSYKSLVKRFSISNCLENRFQQLRYFEQWQKDYHQNTDEHFRKIHLLDLLSVLSK